MYSAHYRGKSIGTDTACVELSNSSGQKDTIKLLVTVVPRTANTIVDTVFAGTGVSEQCLDISNSNLSAAVDTVYNISTSASGTHVTLLVKRNPSCNIGWSIIYVGKNPGLDAACIVLRDVNGNTDTVAVKIHVLQKSIDSKTLTDTIWAYQQKIHCIDTTGLGINAAVDSVWNDCTSTSGKHAEFTIINSTSCPTGNGIPGLTIGIRGGVPGADSACLVIRDKRGFVYRVNIVVTVMMPRADNISIEVEEAKKIHFCVDTTQLWGKIISMSNVCPNKSGAHAIFTLNPIARCIEIEGLKGGSDSACIVLCTEHKVCDTTFLYVQVLPKIIPVVLTAVNDSISTTFPKSVQISVLRNDVYNIADSAKITIGLAGKKPSHGVAIVDNTLQIITYVPDSSKWFCGRDTFEYYIAIGLKRDTAAIVVQVDCSQDSIPPFKIYNAFSPNGDGFNDTFKIEGLENYFQNELKIYTRWGNQVFSSRNYDNSWNGSWDGYPLPDGTYFYVLSLKFGNRVLKESGYLELRR